MKVIGITLNDEYQGFTLTNNIQEEIEMYDSTPLIVVELGECEEEAARNLVDYFTSGSNPDSYNLTDAIYTLTQSGQALWDKLNQ